MLARKHPVQITSLSTFNFTRQKTEQATSLPSYASYHTYQRFYYFVSRSEAFKPILLSSTNVLQRDNHIAMRVCTYTIFAAAVGYQAAAAQSDDTFSFALADEGPFSFDYVDAPSAGAPDGAADAPLVAGAHRPGPRPEAVAPPSSNVGPSIVGGEPMNKGDRPYLVSFGAPNLSFCGGSLIAPRVVLTAARE